MGKALDIASSPTQRWLQNRPEAACAPAHHTLTSPRAEEILDLRPDLVAQSHLGQSAGAHVAMADTEVRVVVSVVAEVQVPSEAQRL